MSDYNKLLFSIKKQTDNLIKKKAKAKAKALLENNVSSEKNIEETINNHVILPNNVSSQPTGFKPFLQPMHKPKYKESVRLLKSQIKMKPNATPQYFNSNQKPYDPPGLMGSPEWIKYNEAYLEPPFFYSQEYNNLVKLHEYRQESYKLELKQEKIPTPAQIKNPKVLIVACEYRGTDFTLNGCLNDADKFKNYILRIHPDAEITYLTDNPELHNYDPTLPLTADRRWPSYTDPTFPSHDVVLKNLIELCKAPNPLLFLFFAGHGGTADDIPAPIESTLIDIDTNGVVQNTTNVADLENPKRKSTYYFCNSYGEMLEDSPLYDSEMYTALKNVSSSQRMYIFTDCCHSGTIFNLPYVHLGNFMYQYDSSGNIVTQTVHEQDDFGHDVHDKDGNAILTQKKLYRMLNDISNNVLNLTVTNDDINTLMTDANTVVSYYDKETGTTKSNTKINFLTAKFPSLTNLNGNIIHFSGTRDNKFSFESKIYDASGNIIDRDGAFTWHFKYLWDLGLNNYTVQKAYTCLLGLINNPEQIPVCSTSKLGLFNNTDFLLDFAPSDSSANVIVTKNKNKSVDKPIINKKPNTNTIINKNLKNINKLVNKKVDLTKKFDADTLKTIIVAQNIFAPKKKNKKAPVPKK